MSIALETRLRLLEQRAAELERRLAEVEARPRPAATIRRRRKRRAAPRTTKTDNGTPAT